MVELNITDSNLLEDLAEKEGRDLMDMLSEATFDSISPGICTSCKSTQTCELDASANICNKCGLSSVKSCLVLARII